jgi:O-antigen/teichoic acid export membrane protein
MQSYVSLTDIGVYTLGYQLGEMVSMLGTAINSAWSPFYYRMFQNHGEEAKIILAPIITYFMLVTSVVGLAIAVLAPEIIRLFSSPAYSNASLVAPWIVASSVIRVFTWITRQGIIYAKRTHWEPVLSLVGGSINIALNLLLLPRIGYIAAAWTTLIGFALIGILSLIVSQRIHPMIYEYKRLVTMIVVAIGVFLISQILPFSSMWLLTISKFVLISLYPVLLWGFGFVSKREVKALHDLRMKVKEKIFPARYA